MGILVPASGSSTLRTFCLSAYVPMRRLQVDRRREGRWCTSRPWKRGRPAHLRRVLAKAWTNGPQSERMGRRRAQGGPTSLHDNSSFFLYREVTERFGYYRRPDESFKDRMEKSGTATVAFALSRADGEGKADGIGARHENFASYTILSDPDCGRPGSGAGEEDTGENEKEATERCSIRTIHVSSVAYHPVSCQSLFHPKHAISEAAEARARALAYSGNDIRESRETGRCFEADGSVTHRPCLNIGTPYARYARYARYIDTQLVPVPCLEHGS